MAVLTTLRRKHWLMLDAFKNQLLHESILLKQPLLGAYSTTFLYEHIIFICLGKYVYIFFLFLSATIT